MFVPIVKSNYDLFGMNSYASKQHSSKIPKNGRIPPKKSTSKKGLFRSTNENDELTEYIQKRSHRAKNMRYTQRLTYSNPLPVIYEDRCLTNEEITKSYEQSAIVLQQTLSLRKSAKLPRTNKFAYATLPITKSYNKNKILNQPQNHVVNKKNRKLNCTNSSENSSSSGIHRNFLTFNWFQKKKSGDSTSSNSNISSPSFPDSSVSNGKDHATITTPNQPLLSTPSYGSYNKQECSIRKHGSNKITRTLSKLFKSPHPTSRLSSTFMKQSNSIPDSLTKLCRGEKHSDFEVRSSSFSENRDIKLPLSSIKKSNSLYDNVKFSSRCNGKENTNHSSTNLQVSKKHTLKLWKQLNNNK